MSILDEYTGFGVAIFLPTCAFEAEVSLHGLEETIAAMNKTMEEHEVPSDVSSRMSAAVQNAIDISALLADGEITQEDAIAEIAFNFIYAFAQQGETQVRSLRGLVGALVDDQLFFSAADDEESFRNSVTTIREIMEEHYGQSGEEWTDAKPTAPTIH